MSWFSWLNSRKDLREVLSEFPLSRPSGQHVESNELEATPEVDCLATKAFRVERIRSKSENKQKLDFFLVLSSGNLFIHKCRGLDLRLTSILGRV
jgi:hypothetical protein